MDFTAARDWYICSNKFQQFYTRMLAERTTSNHIDRFIVDGSCVHIPNINWDHYLIAAEFRLHIIAFRSARSSILQKLYSKKVRSQRTAQALSTLG